MQHFVITRFSIRPQMAVIDTQFGSYDRTLPPLLGAYDPLDPRRLALRFQTFEFACLPGVLSQPGKDFTWVIVVDRALERRWRDRLKVLTALHSRVIIHEYDPVAPLMGTDWLAPYLEEPAPDYLLTTNLDDDDGLPTSFASAVRTWIEERDDRLAPLELFAATELVQWDVDVTRSAPLGFRAEWHRTVPVTSVGFSLLARFPDYPITVMGLGHPVAARLLDWATQPPPDLFSLIAQQEMLSEMASRVGDALPDYPVSETFHDTVPRVGRPLVTNHPENAQGTRLHEEKVREPVTGAESFPDVVVDWDSFSKYAASYRTTRRDRLQYQLRRGLTRLSRVVRRRGGRLKHLILLRLGLR